MPTSKILGGSFEPLEPPHPTGLNTIKSRKKRSVRKNLSKAKQERTATQETPCSIMAVSGRGLFSTHALQISS